MKLANFFGEKIIRMTAENLAATAKALVAIHDKTGDVVMTLGAQINKNASVIHRLWSGTIFVGVVAFGAVFWKFVESGKDLMKELKEELKEKLTALEAPSWSTICKSKTIGWKSS